MIDERSEILSAYRKVGVKTIVTHPRPHLDEIMAIAFARSQHGQAHFPGINMAPIETWSKSDERLKEPPLRLIEQGLLLIGIGGGLFDEHATEHGDAKPGCASTLMAAIMGFDKIGPIAKLLRHIESNDNGQWGPYDFGTVLMQSYEEGPKNDQARAALHEKRCIEDGIFYCRTMVNRHLRFLHEGAAAFAEAELVTVIRRGDRREINMAVGVTDVESFPRYARSDKGNRADVVVVKSPTTGGISIITVDDSFDLTPLARALRMQELRLRKQLHGHDWEEMSRVGVHPHVPEWYLHDERGMVLNTSRVRPDAPVTKIDLESVVQMVIWVVGEWLPELPVDGRTCIGAHACFWERCPAFVLGLNRCRDYRREVGQTTNR